MKTRSLRRNRTVMVAEWKRGTGDLLSVEMCLSCFSVAAKKYPGESSLRKKWFVLAPSSRGIESMVVVKTKRLAEQTWVLAEHMASVPRKQEVTGSAAGLCSVKAHPRWPTSS